MAAFGAKTPFMDVDNLLAGQRFDRELERALAECDVFLAVIGPSWMGSLKERETHSERDYVREEIAAALKRQIHVVPVLVNQAQLPREQTLPEDIRELVKHQKHDLRHEHFGRDMAPLIEAIKMLRKPKGGAAFPATKIVAAVMAVGLVATAFALPHLGMPMPWSPQDKPGVPPATPPLLPAEATKPKADETAESRRRAEEQAAADAAAKEKAEREAADIKRKAEEQAKSVDERIRAEAAAKKAEREATEAKQVADEKAAAEKRRLAADEERRRATAKPTLNEQESQGDDLVRLRSQTEVAARAYNKMEGEYLELRRNLQQICKDNKQKSACINSQLENNDKSARMEKNLAQIQENLSR